MKPYLIHSLVAATLFMAQSAQAAGLGLYGTGGVNFTVWHSYGLKDGTIDYYYGGGLVADTNVMKNELFGYRLSVGYEQYRIKDTESKSLSDPIHRFSMSHTFGFGLIRDEDTRFFIGPCIGLHYLRLRESFWSQEADTLTGLLYPGRTGVSVDMIGVDALLALGINQSFGDIVTIFAQIGFGYMGHYSINIKENGHGFGVDAKLGLLFRIKDTFRQASPSKDGILRVRDIQ